MTAVGVSSGIFRDIFSTEPMRRIFADENRIQKYLDIEAALARTQARLGIIPQHACDEILRHCGIAEYDFAKLKTQTERIGYPVLPVVQQLVALCRDGLGEWCHWGATTQDITDTATVLQIREALDLIETDLVEIEGFADLQDRGGVRDVLGGGAPMTPLAEAVPAQRNELLDDRQHRIADALGLGLELGEIVFGDRAMALDFIACILWN